MSKRVKFSVFGGIILVLVAVGALTAMKRRDKAVDVRMEQVQARDLVASVTASGQVRPHTKVDVASDISGRIVRLGVKEGETVKKGQFLLEIDPAQYQAEVQRSEAAMSRGPSVPRRLLRLLFQGSPTGRGRSEPAGGRHRPPR